MGKERIVRFPSGLVPDWSSIADQLSKAGDPPKVRMIEGLPAFPDEEPPAEWTELRAALQGGMVTLKKQPISVHCICWGSEDAALVHSWNLLCWAVAKVGHGEILEEGEPVRSAGDFLRVVLGSPDGLV